MRKYVRCMARGLDVGASALRMRRGLRVGPLGTLHEGDVPQSGLDAVYPSHR